MNLRSVYTRSLGGVFLDNSVRLEPTQVGGFNQAFRSLIPESVAGLVPATKFETWGLGLDQAFDKTGTYLLAQVELLNSDGDRTVGMLTNSFPPAPELDSPSSTRQSLEYREKSLVLAANQLLGQGFSLGARYRLTEADLTTRFTDLAPTIPGVSAFNQDVSATLHQVQLYGIYNHRCGFFAQVGAVLVAAVQPRLRAEHPGRRLLAIQYCRGISLSAAPGRSGSGPAQSHGSGLSTEPADAL